MNTQRLIMIASAVAVIAAGLALFFWMRAPSAPAASTTPGTETAPSGTAATPASAATPTVIPAGAPANPIVKSEDATPVAPDANGCVASTEFVLNARDIVMGSNDAPLTIVEYASMTCPHCAHVHETVLPELKKNYIDKGLVRYVFREFPIDQLALAASVLTRCVPHDAYHPFVSTLFAQQRTWALSQDIRGSLKELSARAGMNEATFDACLKNKDLATAIIASREEGVKKYCVDSTPTTYLNGRKVASATAAEFSKLDVLLKEKLAKLGKAVPESASGPSPAGAATPASETPAAPAPATTAPATP
jgi:protein-disulfide isomerase